MCLSLVLPALAQVGNGVTVGVPSYTISTIAGNGTLVLSINGVSSNTVTIAVQ
jgi:hypothetical protein